MKLSRELWLEVEPLLTTALEMDATSRTVWLEALDTSQPAVAPLLRKMLQTHERAERAGDMETVPRLVPMPPASTHSAGEHVGPFRLLRQIGRGGMGEVWLAEQADGRVERHVALKLPAMHLQGGVWEERFKRERDILAKLAHPNIARLYDAGVSDAGQPYLAMEYVEGESLTDYVASHALPIPQRLHLFRQVLAATGHAHRHLVVHRDLKPANILIDKSGQVKLLDFGIAKLLDDEGAAADAHDLTRMGGRVMTLRYAAPEQVAAGVITTATDIYALGVILHELVTGVSPYRAAREGRPLTEAMLDKDETGAPSALTPSPIARHVRGDLDAIILKAMRRDPAARYAAIEQFDDDILRHLERRPVKARAGTWRYLAGRFVARHKLPMAIAAAAVLTMAAGLVMVEQQRRVAVAERERAQRHFASVRKLANTFMFEVHGEIEALPGSLKAREMLVKTSLEYLDSLADEAKGDPALMFELAAAYRKIGNIQGETGGANTGDLSASRANFEKGKRLFVSLDALRPNDIEILREHERLSFSLARSYFVASDSRWQAEIATTASLAGRIAAQPDATLRDRAHEAAILAEQAKLTGIAIGRGPAVEDLVRRAVAMVEALAAQHPGDRAILEAEAATYGRAAAAFAGEPRTKESLRTLLDFNRKSLAATERILAGKPDDERWLKFRVLNLVERTAALIHSGEPAEAGRTIDEALKHNAEHYARDPKNVELAIDRLLVLVSAAHATFRGGNHPRTIEFGREALAESMRMPDESRRTISVRNNIAESRALVAAALLATAQAPAIDRKKQLAMLTEARSLLAASLAFYDDLRRETPGAVDESVLAEIKAVAKGCDEAIAKLTRG